MSFFSRSRRSKASSSEKGTSQRSGENIQEALGQHTKSCSDVGTSLFSGMTFTTLPSTTASKDLSLMGHSELLMSSKEQSAPTETSQATVPDVINFHANPDSKLLPEPIQPIPINISQQFNEVAPKKKRTRHIVRPGYARQPEAKATCNLGGKTSDVTEEKSCKNAEQEDAAKEVAGNTKISLQDHVSISSPPTPLYSIGTPSSSEENLNQDHETCVVTSSFVEMLSEGSTTDDLDLDIQNQGDSYNNLEELIDTFSIGSGCQNDDSGPERSDKNFENSMPQECEETDCCSELDTNFSDVLNHPLESYVMLDGASSLSDNVAHDGFDRQSVELQTDLELNEADLKQELHAPQLVDNHGCATCVEAPVLSLSCFDENNYTSFSSTNKLSTILQSIDLQLASLSEDKRSLISFEEEVLQVYSETESDEHKKKQQVTELQKEESQALATDNYDLAEKISSRIDQLKADLESSRYRLPANDDKVGRLLKLRAEIAKREVEIYRDSQCTLEQLHEEQQECLTSHLEIMSTWSVREKQCLSADRQRLERAKDHLKLDKEHMEAENMELSKEILEQTKEFQIRKDELVRERGSLQDEIVELEAKLAMLKEKEAKFTEVIQLEENKIKSVQMTFSTQQSRLDKQQHEIEAREKSLEEELDSLLSNQKHYDEKTAELSVKEKELTGVLSTASEELIKFKDILKELDGEQSFVQEFFSMEHFSFVTDSKLTSLQAKHKAVSQQIKSLSNKIQIRQRSADTLRKRLNLTESQIFDLDAAKEIAKQERNFKEAKRLKEEREALHQEGVKGQEELESSLKQIVEDKKSLEEYEQESNELDKQIGEQDSIAALVMVEKAALIIRQLREKINRISDHSLVKTLLKIEAKTCQNIISDLCQKHGISMPDVEQSQIVNQEDLEERTFKKLQITPREVVLEEDKENSSKLLEKLNELEARLEAAVEVEDFDEADRLQEEITRVKQIVE